LRVVFLGQLQQPTENDLRGDNDRSGGEGGFETGRIGGWGDHVAANVSAAAAAARVAAAAADISVVVVPREFFFLFS